ncbi:outer membrane protein assembly factor BamE [Noviherbaspirillum sp. UKPF54]|nr:outer membrane protein assembly factor BamE [Noviherbaspirillum sp. UKPF54]
MNFSRSDRTPAIAGALCLAVACLAGCASKNPLIDQPAMSGKAPEQQARNAETKPADETAGVTTGAPTGIHRFLGIFTPYRVDIQQGNFISREMVAQLKEGMQRNEAITREQVRFALGTPLLTDIFHADRWDYMFRLKKRSGEIISSRVTVFFKDNRLARIEGGLLPTEQEYLALIAGSAPGATAQGK